MGVQENSPRQVKIIGKGNIKQRLANNADIIAEVHCSGLLFQTEVRKQLRGRPKSTNVTADNRYSSMIGAKICLNHISHQLMKS
jgi:hypothetical protein